MIFFVRLSSLLAYCRVFEYLAFQIAFEITEVHIIDFTDEIEVDISSL